MSRVFGLVALLCILAGACTSEEPVRVAEPSGPVTIRPEVVAQHAREFSTELADREAGSQGEQAAAVYILGHLQQAGYFVQLDGVPVGNLVRSTNLVARPPSGEDPEIVVAVAYGTEDDEPGRGGETIGVFLELARALRVAEPEHSVEFVALGAEPPATVTRGGPGSNALTGSLVEDDLRPAILTFYVAPRRDFFLTAGVGGDDLVGLAEARGLEWAPIIGPGVDSVFNQAGLEHTRVGGPERTGEVLLDYLQDFSR